jgi:NH3-dependent NAD+ synthetase
MVSAYYFAQMLPTVRQRPGGGSLLVLGSGNVEEALRGYLTKYGKNFLLGATMRIFTNVQQIAQVRTLVCIRMCRALVKHELKSPSADPIGSVSKIDLIRFIGMCSSPVLSNKAC